MEKLTIFTCALETLPASFPHEGYLTQIMSQELEELRIAVVSFAQSEAMKKTNIRFVVKLY